MTFLLLLFFILSVVFIFKYISEKKYSENLKKQKEDFEQRVSLVNQQLNDERVRFENELNHSQSQISSLQIFKTKYRSIEEMEAQKAELSSEISNLQKQQSEAVKELQDTELVVLAKSVKIDEYKEFKSDELKNKLAILQKEQDQSIKDGKSISISAPVYSSKRIIDSQSKQILRCFNSECANIINNVTVKNIDTSRAKISRSFDAINKMFVVDGVQITNTYLDSKLKELSLVYAYMLKLEEEKETRKAIREQMVEEDKVRREIEREKQKIAKEESQFNSEIKKLMGYMQKSKDDIERQLYIDKIRDLETKLKKLEADKENVLQREQNTRAGFVYIISNIGSFGENVYKIGMTRRLNPEDRIDELSSASVPFKFDVHALIFSEDAPALETILHQIFNKQQVNKVNPRKEFFKIDLDAIKKEVTEHYNATVRWIDIPEATEYRETLRMENQAEPVAL